MKFIYALLPLLLLGISRYVEAAEQPIVYFDMTYLAELDLNKEAERNRYWDETHLVTGLQGLVNRDEPQLYIRYNTAPDDFWWERMSAEGGWLHGREVLQIADIKTLLERFSDSYSGVVLYDGRIPATSNLASTIAGAENLLAVRFDSEPGSVYTRFVQTGPKLPVRARLISEDGTPMFTGRGSIPGTELTSTGSAKNDAYLWLIEKYIKPGKVAANVAGNYLDYYWFQSWRSSGPQNHTLNNHDYIIAHRGVLFDLNVWEDETPVDDRSQEPGTDLETLKALLHALYDLTGGEQMIHVAGFTPWAYKYTNFGSAGGTHGPVQSEWRYAEILSCFNAYMDADALSFSSMANASFFQHQPVPEVVPQNPKPTLESLRDRGLIDEAGKVVPKNYYANYQGDYDSAAWLYWKMPEIWTDARRGEVPMTWAFNPNLAERFPTGMLWFRETMTPNDTFVAGDSGAGYINPYHLSPPREFSGLPDGLKTWEEHCTRFYTQWDITATGFIIDGNTPGMTTAQWDAYARFSPGGIVAQKTPRRYGLWDGTPYLRISGDLPGAEDMVTVHADIISGNFAEEGPTFNLYRTVLLRPSHYADVHKRIKETSPYEFELVDLYTLMQLIRIQAETEGLVDKTDPGLQPEVSSNLRVILYDSGDGPFTIHKWQGSPSWKLPGRSSVFTYMYLDVDEKEVEELKDHSPTLTIEYWDEQAGELLVEYDSMDSTQTHDGAYSVAPKSVRRGAGPAWRKVQFTMPEPRFENRQNAGADLRLASRGGALYIRRIAIE